MTNLFRGKLGKAGICTVAAIAGFACATSPTGRKQLMLLSDSRMNQMGAQAFQEMKSSQPIDSDPDHIKYVKCVVRPLTEAAREKTAVSEWDVVVFKDPQANAFALPGGKVGVYTGIMKVAKTDSELATVLAHEIGHVMARHGGERVSQQAGTQAGLTALGAITSSNPKSSTLMSLLGLGAQVGILLPFSRAQETEADLIGLDLMAQAGFDPHESVNLWKNMITSSNGKAPPQFLSTHPASENRISQLENHMANAVTLFEQARASGKSPHCGRSQLAF